MGSIRYSIPHPTGGGELRLLYCALSRFDESWNSIPHSHNHAEFFYCVQGKGFLKIVDEKEPLQAGDFFLINPSVEHTEISDPKEGLEYIVIGVDGVRFLTAQGSQPRYYLLNDRSNNHELLPYFQDVLREVSKQREGYPDVCMNIMKILLTKISRYARVDLTGETAVDGTSECTEAKRFMDERFPENITLDWLAERTHISKFYLARTFRQRYGVSPMQYLCRRRIAEASHLLTNYDYSLSAICGMTGFSSPSYFCQAFKRLTGMSPSEYRKVHGRGGE
ncbi:MAG: AraC family transcriptional regulator [Eubacteriales bacterium]|nr:AraC family transcriptional regulator [Eubacteriales bacterium]